MKETRPKLLSSNVILLMIISLIIPSDCFISRSTTSNIPKTQSLRKMKLNAVKLEGYDEAFKVIDQCAVSGEPSDNLYDAVRFVDKNAIKIYPDLTHKQELWNKAHGSWKLQLATGGGKFKDFKPVPIFAFAMIDEENFGNGIGLNEKSIILSLLGPHEFKDKWRQMVISIDDLFLFGSDVTGFVPSFVGNGIGLGKRSSDFKKNGQRPPAFTFIGASEDSLLARGGTGGIAIWTRLRDDIRPAAYGTD